ncbi:autotransporter domain-containing protein [Bradyrhizobium sp. 141]|uniref:autotransporter outer membrane beta-barrel domain-containing protein n=1 Tax=Bradyrhizobium sp. 141 TaxID=2782617 RepID=UPI001FF91BCD|nr:autotransporter domain-containing protein [Bradyrhizobium sp. 141]MCK1719897.1 autotransporter domain-containing protein [Bradyrhizobium sp. 141]
MSKPERSSYGPRLGLGWRARLLGTTALVGLMTAVLAAPACADSEWTGALSSNWFIAGNWSNGVPTTNDSVGISNNSVPSPAIVETSGAAAYSLAVGKSASGSLIIQNGGSLGVQNNSSIGSLGGSGTVIVTGSGSTWSGGSGFFQVGVQTGSTGTLVITAGGTVAAYDITLGVQSGSVGNAVVDGANSRLESSLILGQSGTGTLTVSNGGTVASARPLIGGNAGLNGTGTLNIGAASGQAAAAPGVVSAPEVTFFGSTSTIVFNHTSNNYSFAPAISGTGAVMVESGTTTFTGQNTYGNGTFIKGGTLEVSGPSGAINSGAAVAVGTLAGSTGTLKVTGGGTVTGNNGLIGSAAGATGAATVSGAGSIWTSTAFLAVGDTGNGSLTIANGGTVIGNTSASIGSGAGTTGSVTVTGANSRFFGNSSIAVGLQANGSLLVEAGGVARALNSFVGVFGTGAATVTGAGSAWNTDTNFSLGANGQGALTIADGGSVSIGNTLTIAVNGGSTGTLNIGAASGQAAAAAGTLVTPSVVFGAGTGRIVFNHTDTGYVFASNVSGAGATRTEAGTTIFTGTNTYSGGTTITGGTLQLGNGGTTGSITGNVTNNAILAFNRSDSYGFGGVISGTGVVQQNGPGNTTLTATNTYVGGTVLNAGTLSVGADTNLGNAAGGLSFNGGTLQVTGTSFTSTARAINWGAHGGGFDIAYAGSAFTLSEAIGSGGALTKSGAGDLVLTAANTYVGGTTIVAGTLWLGNGGTTGSIIGDITNHGTLAFDRFNAYQFDGVIAGSGALQQSGLGTTTLTAANIYSGGTTIAAGALQLGNGGTTGSIVGNVLDNARFVINRSDIFTFAGTISGSGTFEQLGTGTTVLTNANSYSGGTTIAGGTLRVENNAALGTGAVTTTGSVLDYADGITLANPIQVNSNHTQLQVLAGTATQAGIISELNGPRPLEKIGAGRLVLTSVNTYTGPTMVSGGTLDVAGSIAASSLTMVNAGAALMGTGVIGHTMIANGATFLPGSGTSGSSMTVNGNLALQSGAAYLVQISPTAASFANVSGSATLNGTVSATYANTGNFAKRYTILSAAGGISGTFGALASSNLPSNFTMSLSYDPTHAYVDLTLAFTPSGPGSNTGLTGNQQTIANALTGYFNSNGGIPMAFGTLSAIGLAQVSGEAATGTQQTTFQAMNLFMGVLLDPWLDGRAGDAAQGSASQFAENNAANADTSSAGKTRSRAERDAYAAIYTKALPRIADPFASGWNVWAAGFGGSQTTSGNARLGTSAATGRVYGTAIGADYRFSPDTLAGFALAGGGTNFSIANSLGQGSSDLFQAGAFIRHTAGAAYLSAALAYGWQDVTTDRTVTVVGVDRLRARVNANAFSARIEGGYRFITPLIGVTPYAAAQVTAFDLPAYAEGVLSGSMIALEYASRAVTASRSELGWRTDKSYAVGTATLVLRSRLAWAHDFNPDRSIAASFQTLPGASFVVNGAAQARDAAMTTASAEMKFMNGVSLAATFEGEFSNVTRSYAGKGVARYSW